jgi:hypothetical protein
LLVTRHLLLKADFSFSFAFLSKLVYDRKKGTYQLRFAKSAILCFQ